MKKLIVEILKVKYLFLLGILALTVFIFFPVRAFEFTNWDDHIQVVNNPDIVEISMASIHHMFTKFYIGMYQPISTLSYSVDYAVFGMSPSGFHISSLFLHLINVVLVFLLFTKLRFRWQVALFVSAFFAIHPLQVEAVCWISARSTLLYSMFFLLALLSYAEFNLSKKKYLYVLTLCLFLLSILSKPSAAPFVLFIPLLDYYYNEKIQVRSLFRIIPFLMISIAAVAITLYSRKDAGHLSAESDAGFSAMQHIGFAFWSVIKYGVGSVIPFMQNIYQTYPLNFEWYMIILPLCVIAFLIYLIMKCKDRKILILSLGFFLIPLSIHLKFIPVGEQMMADRYMYLSIIGIMLLPSLYSVKYWFSAQQLFKKWMPVSFLIVFVVMLSVISGFHVTTWKNSEVLWTNVIRNNPQQLIGYYNRGCALREKGRIIEAIDDFSAAIAIQPIHFDALMARGALYAAIHEYSKAIIDYNVAASAKPEMYLVYLNRGNAYYFTGDFISAKADYKRVLQYEPTHADAGFSLILCMIETNTAVSEIYDQLNTFLALHPNHAEAYYLRGLVSTEVAPDDACDDFKSAANLGHDQAKQFVMKFCL